MKNPSDSLHQHNRKSSKDFPGRVASDDLRDDSFLSMKAYEELTHGWVVVNVWARKKHASILFDDFELLTKHSRKVVVFLSRDAAILECNRLRALRFSFTEYRICEVW